MDVGVEDRKVAVEIIASLVNLKHTMFELVLKPAGVSPAIYQPVFRMQDETGKAISKRKAAPLLLDRLGEQEAGVIRRLIEIAANWPSERFHLAFNEFEARATVQKAREVLGRLEQMEAVEAERRAQEARRQEAERLREQERKAQEDAAQRRKEIAACLDMFQHLTTLDDHQRRGFVLQNLLNQLFKASGIPVVKSFTRNDGGEQIDGAFKLDGWHFIVESRWRTKPADVRDLDGLLGQISRSGRQIMGVFLSINGWSENVVPLLKQNAEKAIILMDGYDLLTTLDGRMALAELLEAKLARLNLYSEPFLSAAVYLQQRGAA